MKFFNKFTSWAPLFLLILCPLLIQGCNGYLSLDSHKVDQAMVDGLTEQDAHLMMNTIVRARMHNSQSTCRISKDGLAGDSGVFFAFDQLKFSYDIRFVDPIVRAVFTDFHNKEDGSEVCTFEICIPQWGYSQRQFEWQAELITPSMIVLGAEFDQ